VEGEKALKQIVYDEFGLVICDILKPLAKAQLIYRIQLMLEENFAAIGLYWRLSLIK